MLFQTNGICPLCNAKGEDWCTAMDWEYRSTYNTYHYLKCSKCGSLFIKEVPESDLLTIYPKNYYAFGKEGSGLLFKLKNTWDRFYYKSILKNITSCNISVLDIGGGTGEVLDLIKLADKRIGYTEIVDIDPASRVIAEKKGHTFSLCPIENYSSGRKFDLILLLNILEHVGNPAYVLELAGNLLNPGGVLIIKTPNCNSLDARLFRKHYWGGLHCPRHWIIFSNTSIEILIAQSKLNLQKINFTQGAPFWAYSIINLFRKKDIKRQTVPLIAHWLFTPLSIIFALFDIVRSPFSKTSQMFISLSK
jgi:SAM-dependent methyltransferase